MKVIASNITSPLGCTTEANYRAVREGRTVLRQHEAGERGVPFRFCASLFQEQPEFEELAFQSASEALMQVKESVDLSRTVFILSTTKGDLGTPLGTTATAIACRLGIKSKPIVVCNACISGVAAQALAVNLLRCQTYDYAVVTGADVITDFIVSGFHSLKALSAEPCRPFDIDRTGLNLGEAAATVVICRDDNDAKGLFFINQCALTNDAYHITNPHPQGNGCLSAIQQVTAGLDISQLATINAHGTATMYNDQMESKAIERAGLSSVPTSALKGYYGHTMGAAGLLETILTARGLLDGIVIASKGYSEIGVSGKVCISDKDQTVAGRDAKQRSFVKIISGFGGCNAALLGTVGDDMTQRNHCYQYHAVLAAQTTISSTNSDVTELFHEEIVKKTGSYPRFYKMDAQCRMALVAANRLIDAETDREHTAIVLFNRCASAVADRKFAASISDVNNYFPSPSAFVYTLPNIATGEIAMRHGLISETSFYVLPDNDEEMMQQIVNATFQNKNIHRIIGGWIDCRDKEHCECELKIWRREE